SSNALVLTTPDRADTSQRKPPLAGGGESNCRHTKCYTPRTKIQDMTRLFLANMTPLLSGNFVTGCGVSKLSPSICANLLNGGTANTPKLRRLSRERELSQASAVLRSSCCPA